MSKGLEELEKIKLKWQYGVFTFIPNFEIVENELEEGQLAINFVNRVYDIIGGENDIDIIIDKVEKQKKALELIKNKQVDVWLFNNNDNFNDYNWAIELCYHREKASDYYLTEEEYDLLKEVLL